MILFSAKNHGKIRVRTVLVCTLYLNKIWQFTKILFIKTAMAVAGTNKEHGQTRQVRQALALSANILVAA
jgi:hypothetical protein